MLASAKMGQSFWRLFGPPILIGMVLGGLHIGGAQAETPESKASTTPVYVISDNEGYGVVDCITKRNSPCGKAVADSWCEAHGHGPAKAFGPASDITASVGPATLRDASRPGAAIVTCQE